MTGVGRAAAAAVLAIVAWAYGSASATADGAVVDVALDFTYSSLRYWRGDQSGHGSAAIPSADVSVTSGEVSVGVNLWYAQGLELGPTDDNNELDYTAYAAASAGPVDATVGATNLLVPLDAPFKDGRSTLELWGGVSFPGLPFDNDVRFSLNVDGDEDDSWYLAPSVGYTVDHLTLAMTLGIAGASPGYYGNAGSALIDVTPSISYSIPLGDAEAAASLAIGYNPDAKVTVPYFTMGIGWGP